MTLVSIHEFILVYAKDLSGIDAIEVPLPEESIKRYYTLKDKNFPTRGPYRTHPLEAMKSFEERQNLVFPIPSPDGTKIWPKRQWRWSKERFDEALKKDEVEFLKSKDGEWVVHSKQYLNDEDGTIRTAKAFSIIDNIYTQHGTNEIIDLFGNAQIFPFPKPSKLMMKLINIATSSMDNCIVLDFFAGSSALPHAIYHQNQLDKGKRKYIAVQLPERIKEKSEANKAGYKTIADIGMKRIRRVIGKIEKEQKEKIKEAEGKLPGFGERPPEIDLGFKVFKLDKSNFKIWAGPESDASEDEISKQLELHIDHIDPNSSREDILYELLMKAGFMLTEKVETKKLAGKTVHSVAGGALLICLENEITRELIDAVAKAEPKQFICLDRGFQGNDQLKANAVQTFAARNRSKETAEQIVFRTV